MASSITATSSVVSVASPHCGRMDDKILSSLSRLLSLASISSSSFVGRRKDVNLQKRRSLKVKAIAKELHFNQDGDTIKKVQLSWQLVVGVICGQRISFVNHYLTNSFISDCCKQAYRFNGCYPLSEREECVLDSRNGCPKIVNDGVCCERGILIIEQLAPVSVHSRHCIY
ncbi:ruBisCO large subunit-binding protein subunit beta, chloroplastic-like isoform X1 [Mangifera indica]|uniref:ruBisCO large subunit-binding protein subunit beta, chloroplastic-like isoform X1 n=1 Tax=Mangifera indica TaxID=29780 RepID=UPI001CF9E82F|nr:ruBisCO large subunit-binding protein subunit beta, chloroplastic-like isoform X1 [Mangifera indica]